MQLREFDFTQVTSVKKRCILYAKDGNTVVKHWRLLYPLTVITGHSDFKGLFLEYKKENYSECFRIYNDLGSDCVEYGYLSGWYGVTEETVEHLRAHEPFIGLDGFKKRLAQMEAENGWINNAMIRGLADAGETELAAHYRAYHESQLQARAERDLARHQALEKERQQQEREQQERLKKQVSEAETCILKRQELMNAPCEGGTIILCLMKKHGVTPPLRTQGWINEKLVKVTMHDNSVTFTFQKQKKCQASKTVSDYLFQLRDKIDLAYSAVQSA